MSDTDGRDGIFLVNIFFSQCIRFITGLLHYTADRIFFLKSIALLFVLITLFIFNLRHFSSVFHIQYYRAQALKMPSSGEHQQKHVLVKWKLFPKMKHLLDI